MEQTILPSPSICLAAERYWWQWAVLRPVDGRELTKKLQRVATGLPPRPRQLQLQCLIVPEIFLMNTCEGHS